MDGNWRWFPEEDEEGNEESDSAAQEGDDNNNDTESYDELVTFDGETLTLYLPGGRTIPLKAVAGGLKEGKTDPTLQREPNVGPIPEGKWRFNPGGIERITTRDIIRGLIYRGRWPGSVAAWGLRRVWPGPAAGTRTIR